VKRSMDFIDATKIVEEKISDEIESLSFAIATGKVEGWEQYKWMTGRLRGLQDAKLMVAEAVARYAESE